MRISSALSILFLSASALFAQPTLYLIGDSTVHNGRGDGGTNLQWGWGEMLPYHFDSARIRIANRALGGRSSRTFLTEGDWEKVVAALQPGDFVIMQFGHNDPGPLDDTQRARGSIQGIGGETREINNPITKKREVVHTYGWYLQKFVAEAKAKGATPIVCSPVPRNVWKEGKVERGSAGYGLWARQIAEAESVPFLDLNERIAARYEAMGESAVTRLFPGDHTHTGWTGARINAAEVVAALRALTPNPLAPCLLAAPRSPEEWTSNGGTSNIRYSPLRQVDPANVAKLQVAWTYDTKDAFKGSEMQSNPIVSEGIVYFTSPKMRAIALNAATGQEIWNFDLSQGVKLPGRFRHRGVTLYKDRIFVTYRNWLFALDRYTGKPIPSFGEEGRIDLRKDLGRPVEGVTISASSPGAIFEDMIIMGSTVSETLPGSPGHIRAWDAATGKLRWIFHTIPHPGEYGYETWPPEAYKINGGANAWAGLTIDAPNGFVFAATGSASFDFYGANRVGDDLFANCLLALDARTGKRVWHFQAVKHDVWDMDFPAAPSLVTVTRDGQAVDAVAQITKQGFVYVFERKTGKPLFPIEYRKVPASNIEGEKLAETQPYPVKPPPFARQILTEDMLTQRTPEAHAAVLAQFRKLKSNGMYTPPSLEGTVVFPGYDGGAEWGGAAYDQSSGLLFVNSNEMAWILRMVKRDDRSLYKAYCASCHRDDLKGTPPSFPSLVDIGKRKSREDLVAIVRNGNGRMPGFIEIGSGVIADIVDFLLTGNDHSVNSDNDPNWVKYRNDGYNIFQDPDGYPAVAPPWGTLNAIDLNSGELRWKIPFGEFPELAAKGQTNTGSDNYGGPVVTASGLLFIGATNFDRKFHAYDKLTGKLLWEATLPAAGNATPSIYEVNGREYIVIACGGGKNGAPSGGSVVAFALPLEESK